MRYKILSGYIDLEPEDNTLQEIADGLAKIAKTPADDVEQIQKPEDIEKVGERGGDPDNFLKEK